MPANKNFLIALILLCSPLTHALVDYTEAEAFSPQKSGASSVATKAPVSRSVTKPKQSSNTSEPMGFNTGLSYGTQDIELDGQSGKVETMGFEGHFQTRYNVFMAVSYFQTKSSSSSLVTERTSFQKGNPQIILGFNWLQFGKPSDLATIDLYGGISLGQSNSDFATERTDQLVGISTAKRFYNVALGLGYEVRLTGSGVANEMAIGNISKLSASLGWVVSPDIRFLIEGSTYSIESSDDSGAALRLQEKVSFSTVKPQLQLKITPLVDLTLGAKFRTKRLKDSNLTQARLWNLEGAYGNGIFAGLSFNI
ncbi:MAG: hypothetical protein K9K67_04105 [Bacteriovoracaceae bacterium]|nr:hypothetical protein [Bacteriovoracaceae bacterium]